MAKQKRASEEEVLSQLDCLSKKESLSITERGEYIKLQNKLDELYEEKAKGA